ncbi:MAG TPA: SHOCT domain-containing protein [Microlunatus sp.]
MPGLIRGVARTAVVAGTATAVSGRVSRRQQGRWAAKEEAAAAEQAPEAAPEPVQYQDEPPAAPSTDDKLAQLKQLGELRDAGVLTESEFEAQKGKILYAS